MFMMLPSRARVPDREYHWTPRYEPHTLTPLLRTWRKNRGTYSTCRCTETGTSLVTTYTSATTETCAQATESWVVSGIFYDGIP